MRTRVAAVGGGRLRQHVHPARGQVDRADHVAGLRLLGQAGRGAVGEHLVEVRGGGTVGQHHERGVRIGSCGARTPASASAACRGSGATTLGWWRVDRLVEIVDRHVGLHEIKVRVLGDEDAQGERDEILEPCRNHGWHRRGSLGARVKARANPDRLSSRDYGNWSVATSAAASYAAASWATLRCTSPVDTTCLPIPSSLGSRPSARPDHLRQVQDGHAEVALDEARGRRLLHVQVQVAERAGGHEAVGARRRWRRRGAGRPGAARWCGSW